MTDRDMNNREKVIRELESLRDICNAKSNMAFGKGKIAWAGYANAADDAISMLKEQEAKIGHWIDTTKVIGFPRVECSVCGSGQGAIWMDYCPICGAKMEGR